MEKALSGQRHHSSADNKTIESWKLNHPWLIVLQTDTGIILKCSVCSEAKVSSIWAQEGSCNVQKNSVTRHSQSSEHGKAELSCIQQKVCSESSSDCKTEESDDYKPRVKEEDIKLFRTVFCLTKKLQPPDMINTFLQLQSLNGVNLQYQNLSWDSIKDIQSCISDTIQRSIIEAVLISLFYGIPLDESTDISVQKHLSICIRYVLNGEPVTKFLTNVSLDDGKAHTIVNVTVKRLEDFGLNLSNMVSLATDGASVMTGRKTGVGVQLKSKFSPFSTQTHCIAHRLNLAVSDSIKKNELLKKMKDKFDGLYSFMSGSSNRTSWLQKLQEILDEPDLTIKEPHSIRWLRLRNAELAVY